MTLASLADELASGRLTSRALIEQCLERAEGSRHQGNVAFISIDADRVRADADAADEARRQGRAASPFTGIPVSIKDLFDVEGEVTTAGSRIFAGNPPAAADAAPVARLRAAGFIPFGRANMTEFAFSGLGMNAHYGDPASPWQRDVGRVSGGSSSGGAVSVAEGIVPLTLGTDTGGSCRIPAACCGITGYKPTASRVPQDGTVPLSKSLDSIGPLANSVACCASAFAVLAGERAKELQARPVSGLKLGVLRNFVLDGMDSVVSEAFENALQKLSAAGAEFADVTFTPIDRLPEINVRGGLATAEAFQFHAQFIKDREAQYDQRVASRIRRAEAQQEGEYEHLLQERARMIGQAVEAFAPYDAIVMPTIPVVPPRFADCAEDADYIRNNFLLLRNPSVGNWLDRCGISLPMTPHGEAPAGFMLMGKAGEDEALFGIAAGVEDVLRSAMGR
ncbi:MAG: amidase [Rhodobiaceae bacterium]|nr:amidase [Rhodobiaceae bacterium]MCC0048110.1 amidase [Rhodobiaceae bacterium]